MCQVLDGTRCGFLPKHLDHMNGLLLLRKMSGGSRSDQVIRIGANVNISSTTADVHPKATEHLASTMAFANSVKLSNGCGQSRAIDFMRLELYQRPTSMLRLVTWLTKEDCLATLGAAIRIVSVGGIWKANNPEVTLQRPILEVGRLKFDGADKLIQSLQISVSRRG